MRTSRFEYTQETEGTILVFHLIGSLDIGTVATMRADLDALLSVGQHQVIFDVHELEQIDSSGIGAIIALFKRVRSNKGEMKIANLVGQPREIFSLLRLDRVFDIHESIDHALKSFGA